MYICGTLHLDRGVTKEMREKIGYLKKEKPLSVMAIPEKGSHFLS